MIGVVRRIAAWFLYALRRDVVLDVEQVWVPTPV